VTLLTSRAREGLHQHPGSGAADTDRLPLEGLSAFGGGRKDCKRRASVGRQGSMKPGGRRTGELERQSIGFVIPVERRERESTKPIGSPPMRSTGSADRSGGCHGEPPDRRKTRPLLARDGRRLEIINGSVRSRCPTLPPPTAAGAQCGQFALQPAGDLAGGH
jgi:hypothetical protein